MTNRRIKTVIGLRYADAKIIGALVHEMEAMLHAHPGIDASKTLFVKLVKFNASSLDLLVYTFTKTTNWVEFQGVQQDVFLKLLEIINAHGAECAFPSRSVYHYKETESPQSSAGRRQKCHFDCEGSHNNRGHNQKSILARLQGQHSRPFVGHVSDGLRLVQEHS